MKMYYQGQSGLKLKDVIFFIFVLLSLGFIFIRVLLPFIGIIILFFFGRRAIKWLLSQPLFNKSTIPEEHIERHSDNYTAGETIEINPEKA